MPKQIKPPQVHIAREDGAEPVGVELLESSIVEIAEGMKRVIGTRVRLDTIITLIHNQTGVSRRQIRSVIDTLEQLEQIFLKPKK